MSCNDPLDHRTSCQEAAGSEDDDLTDWTLNEGSPKVRSRPDFSIPGISLQYPGPSSERKVVLMSAEQLTQLTLVGHDGTPRGVFAVGETVFVTGRGLPPSSMFTLSLEPETSSDKAEMLANYMSDRHGVLPVTVLIPYLGLIGKGALSTRLEAMQALSGRKHTIHVRSTSAEKPLVQTLTFAISEHDSNPFLHSSDAKGHLLTGIEHDSAEAGVMLHNFRAGCVRVYVVARQFGWRPGDPIVPVLGAQGAPIVATVSVRANEARYVPLSAAGALQPGSYQFIARSFQPGWFEADEPVLLRGDVLSDSRSASLVVRIPWKLRFPYDNGVVLTPQIAGRPLAHRPYFHFVDNFPKGTDVYAALDPDALPGGLVSKKAAIYVIRHKTDVEWAASNGLADISGPGMTSAVKTVPIVPGCVNWNTTLVWPNPQVPGKYDIVIDFGNNAADPALFATDGTLDAPFDMIDGYVRTGFYVTDDPSLPGPSAGSIGRHDYALPSIDVPKTDAGPMPTDSLPVTATIRYPAQFSGIDAPVAAGAFPLIVIMHGNSGMDTSYLGYNYLLDHLASWGFMAMSIYAPVGVFIETRARAILAHIGIMAANNTNPGLFQGHVDLNHIGIMGHSRGAEAVVRAARINTAEALGWNIQAGISIAPTDYFHYGDPGVPLLVIYGANDGDVSGAWPDRTGFDIYDEAGRPRSFVFVYGATHDRFNTEWASIEATTELNWDISPGDIPKLISTTDHENVAKGYATAFFQAHLLSRDEQLEYFSSGLKPSLISSLALHVSHQTAGSLILDDFREGGVGVNTLGGVVTSTSLTTFVENQLRTLDGHSPHTTAGGNVAWQNGTGTYVSQIPAAAKNVSGRATLSFRVTQKYESPKNPSGQPLDFFVRLTDGGGNSRAIRAGIFTDIPYPYVRGHDDLVKSAMKSVRMPLASFTIANAGAQDVDLANLTSVSFVFTTQTSGEIEIDDIEFGD